MSEQQKGPGTPFLVNSLLTRTQRLDSIGSGRGLGSPIDTFRATEARYNKGANGSEMSVDDMESINFYNRNTESRISISESCIESESDSESDERKSHDSIPKNNPSEVSLEKKGSVQIYKNVFTSSTSSLDVVDEETSDYDIGLMRDENGDDDDHEEDEEDQKGNINGTEENDGRLPSAGNYLTEMNGLKGGVKRTESISNSKRPTVDHVKTAAEGHILARASPIHKHKQRTSSFASGLVQKKKRSSSSSNAAAHGIRNGISDVPPILSREQPIMSREQPLLSREQPLPSREQPLLSREQPPPSREQPLLRWSFDKEGVPLLVAEEQTNQFIVQFASKYRSYMQRNSVESLKEAHVTAELLNAEFDSDEYTRFMKYPTLKLLEMMSCLLTKIVHTNDELGRNSATMLKEASSGDVSTTNKTVLFRGQNIPHFPINKYLQRAHQYCATSNDVYLSLLVYFDRLSQPSAENLEPKLILDSYNIHRLIITAFTVATKFSQDVYFTNKRYAKVGGISDTELNKLELAFLDLLRWEKLRCSGTSLLKYWKLLNGFWEREQIRGPAGCSEGC